MFVNEDLASVNASLRTSESGKDFDRGRCVATSLSTLFELLLLSIGSVSKAPENASLV